MTSKSKTKKTKARSALTPDQVKGLLTERQSTGLLRALGLITERGGASADAHRKIKQIVHLLRLMQPGIDDVLQRHPTAAFVDAAAGKAYIGLATYEALLRETEASLYAIESRAELAERVREIANQHGFKGVRSIHGTIADASAPGSDLPERVHHVFALHACDTATDEALVLAIERSADYVVVVPCCQAEVAAQLKANGSSDPLYSHAHHRREFGAHLTNVIRALVLRACGYQVTVTELAGWEHAVKNEVILGRRVGRFHEPSRAELRALLGQFSVKPMLVERLESTLWPEAAVK